MDGSYILHFKTYFKSTVIKTVWFCVRKEDQWNRIERLEISYYVYDPLIFDKIAPNHTAQERIISSINKSSKTTGYLYAKE